MSLKVLLFSLFAVLILSACSRAYSAHVLDRYPAQGEFVLTSSYSFTENLKIHLKTCGQGQPLIYIHGNYGSYLDFFESPIAASLCKKYRVIAFDRPGSGYTTRPDDLTMSLDQHSEVVVKILDYYSIEKANILAHSFGGAIAMDLALRHADRISSLYLIAPAIYPWPGDKVFLKDKIVLTPYLGSLFLETLFLPVAELVASRNYQQVFSSANIPSSYYRQAKSLAIRPETFLATAKDTAILWDTLEQLSIEYERLEMPINIVHGDSDTSVLLDVHSMRLKKLKPETKLITVPGAGHQPQFTHPRRVLELFN